MLTTKVSNFLYAQATSKFLQEQEWSNFCTFTTPYELTLPSARRLMERFHDRITKNIFSGEKPKFFWIAEKFECKDGFHTHGLLHYDKSYFPTGCNPVEVLDESYQIVSGARKQTQYKKFRVSFSPYDKSRGAGKYCAKYLMKYCADYDWL